jgi:chemotaxis family two-component system response regulator Rcp1
MRRAIKGAKLDVDIFVVKDGEQAIRFFDVADSDDQTSCPDLVILDINLPKRHGGEVLKHIRKSSKCAQAVVIAVSTSDSPRDREDMLNAGANGYFRKPSEHADFMKLGDIIKNMLAG